MYDYRVLVKKLREKLIITQKEMASILGVSFASINRYENGKTVPTMKVKRKIVELCKENKIELVEKEGELENG